jgi:hypothetical protein
MWIAAIGVTIILPQILTYFGYYSGIFTQSIWGKQGMIYFGDPLWVDTVCHGVALGILVFMILINYKYFANTIKQAMGSTPASEVSYKLAYLLVAIGAVGLIALFAASGVDLVDAVLGLIIIWMQLIVLTRARAYSANIIFMRSSYYFKPFWGPTMPPAPEFPAGKLFIETHTHRWGTGCDTFGPYYSSMMGTMDGFKIGSMSGVHPNLVFRLCLIGAIISAIIVIPLTFIIWHAYGFMELPVAKEWDYFWDGDSGSYNGRPSIISVHGIFGFVLAGILLFLRARYLWWPIEPIGVMLGTAETMPWHISAFTPFIVWIVKYAVIKFGGRRLYDEVGIPAAFGIITGEMIGIILVSAINIFRFVVFGAA